MASVVVLSSGGMDSGVLLKRACAQGRNPIALFFAYGQPAQLQEWRSVIAQGRALGVRVEEIHLGLWCGPMLGLGLPGPRVVAGRNSVFVAIAANYAASCGASEVWLGAIAADQREYADCRPEWAAHMTAALGIPVVLPLCGATKREVIAELGDLPSWSCYCPDAAGGACGRCNSCLAAQGVMW